MINNISATHIAFLGPKGSYSHIAAIKYTQNYFDHIIEHSCQNFSDIIYLVENHKAEYGILPIENSNSGLIEEVCDLLLNTRLILIGDITIPIHHRILTNNHISLQKIKIIYSHPQPIQQCSKFLKNFSTWKTILCASSSGAIRTVANLNKTNVAALGSAQGGMFYGLKPLFPKNIANFPHNTTRFIILKNKNIIFYDSIYTTMSNKIMLIISIDQELNKLYIILKILQFYNIKINFLRLRKSFNNIKTHMIILEIIANFNVSNVQQSLINISKISNSLKILGCYPSLIYH